MSEKNNQVVYSRRCWIEGSFQEATLYLEDGKIKKIEKGGAPPKDPFTDCSELVLMPGVIDAHVHVNEPGRAEWEGFDTATQAAAAGGITTLIDMPLNASPVTTTKKAFEQKLVAGRNQLHINCGLYGGLVPDNASDLEALIESGVFGIKAFLTHSGIDEFPDVGEKEINEAMPLLAKYNIPLLAHCELSEEGKDGAFGQNPKSYQHYLASRPKDWENRAVELVISLCRKHGCPTHIVHVSSAESLTIIRKAKSEGLPLTAETCPHYILFKSELIPDANTLYKCAPPIREGANNELLKQALKNGVLDFIASDHSPAPPAIKELDTGDLKKAWGGIAGLQFLLPASWTALHELMSLETFIPLLTDHPAQFLAMDRRKGFLKEGYDADLVAWSPETVFRVNQEAIFHKHKISPYVSQNLQGMVHHTWVNGQLVFSNGQIIKKNSGQWLFRK